MLERPRDYFEYQINGIQKCPRVQKTKTNTVVEEILLTAKEIFVIGFAKMA